MCVMQYGLWRMNFRFVVKSGVNVSEVKKNRYNVLSVSEIKCVDEMFFFCCKFIFEKKKYF